MTTCDWHGLVTFCPGLPWPPGQGMGCSTGDRKQSQNFHEPPPASRLGCHLLLRGEDESVSITFTNMDSDVLSHIFNVSCLR